MSIQLQMFTRYRLRPDGVASAHGDYVKRDGGVTRDMSASAHFDSMTEAILFGMKLPYSTEVKAMTGAELDAVTSGNQSQIH